MTTRITLRIYQAVLIVLLLHGASCRGNFLDPHTPAFDAVEASESSLELRGTQSTSERPLPSPEQNFGGSQIVSVQTTDLPESEIISEQPASQGPFYSVNRISFSYAIEHPEHPPLEPLTSLVVPLVLEGGYYVEDQTGKHYLKVSDLAGYGSIHELHSSAVIAIAKAVVEYFNRQDIVGVFVAVDPTDISDDGTDLRAHGDYHLHFVIFSTEIRCVHTVGLGDRFSDDHCDDNPAHSHILSCSPLQGPCWDEAGSYGDLLRKTVIDNYLSHLNRYPDRQTAVDIAPTETPGIVDLRYRILEGKPWKAYATASNTGSQNKYPWMESIGVIHYHLTGQDDLLTLDYKTTNFQDMHFVRGYYEMPCSCYHRCRLFAEGIWSDFVSAEFGTFDFDDEFAGSQKKISLGGICNIWQCGDFFVDLRASVDWFNVSVTNRIADTYGETSFVIPRLMFIAERKRRTSRLFSTLGIEGNIPSIAGTDRSELRFLGRETSDHWFYVLRGSLYASVCLDEWLHPARDCKEEDFCNSQARPALRHEISLLVDGQYAFNRRLIPQLERTLGGLYSVRGYPQSLVSGADAVFGQLEYRHHLPTFWNCWHVLGRLFLDAGRSVFNKPGNSEFARGLSSVGFGVQSEYKTNLRARVDVGFALEEQKDLHIHRGHTQIFTSMTVIY
ncbi:hypothetical protein SCG7086_BC_00160 [Chlamydiales bacterium SCGC AG-110-P3]|nr:hypothetical protein SCG7086_BC_00160 [Chlamydiales bacterium SCGC AG-110-P3]